MMKKKFVLILSMVALMAMFAGCKQVGNAVSDAGRATSEVLSKADDAVSDTVSRMEEDAKETESRLEEDEDSFRGEYESAQIEDESVLPED